MATLDAAGCNWISYQDPFSKNTFCYALPWYIIKKYPSVDFDVKCLMKDPVTKQWLIFIADMPHLTKIILTCLKLSSSKKSKQHLKHGNMPINMGMIEEIWQRCDGASSQLHMTKLTNQHFEKNAFSQMNVKLATQLFSASTANMIQTAIGDNHIVLSLNNKGMYNHDADLCECWNVVVDICNGRDRPHSTANACERQTILLKIYVWFCRWKELHDERVRDKRATEYNYFANETWFCIKTLLLGHVMAIQIYCVKQGESVTPQTMNTDTVEWFFGDARQMVGGSTN